MNQQRAFTNQIIYIVGICLCIPPLFIFGRPSTVVPTPNGTEIRPGGMLSKIRYDKNLSEVQLGEIDPASSTVKLATLGLRGVAITLLWHQSQEYEKRKDWNNVITTSNQIIQLEPHFISVWEFLGWRLAYNASAEFDDYRERYRWVIRGFDFVVDGTRYNVNSPILHQKAGWVISQKIGIADEKEQYRRLLREDEDFHKKYLTESWLDRDNWLIGREWYKKAEQLVQKGWSIGKTSEPLFFSYSRMNLIHYAEWMAKDGRFGEDGKGEQIKERWKNASEEWQRFGQMDFKTAIPKENNPDEIWETTLLTYWEKLGKEKELNEELRNLEPGLYERIILENWDKLLERANGEEVQASLHQWLNSEDSEAAVVRAHLDETRPNWREEFEATAQKTYETALGENGDLAEIPDILLSESERAITEKVNGTIVQMRANAIGTVKVSPQHLVDRISGEKRPRALEIQSELKLVAREKQLSDLFRGILNYAHHERVVVVEQEDETIQGRRHLYEARRKYRDGEQSEANRIWLGAMAQWEKLLAKPGFEDIGEDPQFTTDILDLVTRYVIILDSEERLFPEKFPLQDYVRETLDKEGMLTSLQKAEAYTDKIYEAGDYAKALEYYRIITNQYGLMNTSYEYMKLAPLPEIRDRALLSAARYVNCLRNEKQSLPEYFGLKLYVDLLLKNDPMQQQAVLKTESGLSLLAEEKYPEAQTALEEAFALWKDVLEKYPIIYMERDSRYYAEIERAATQYVRTLEMQGKTLPEDFQWKEFLP